MSKIVRFVVGVGSDWSVAISCSEHAAWAANPAAQGYAMGSVDDGLGGRFPGASVALHLPDTPHAALPAEAPVAGIRADYDSVWQRNQAQVRRFGHYLYDALLGPREVAAAGPSGRTVEPWKEMLQFAESVGADTLELALSLGDDPDLLRLNWEMMCSDSGFIAAGTQKLRVAITRLVDAPGEPPRQLGAPPRVLFVVGTSLGDEQIRPAAEMLGLLRRLRSDRTIHHRLIERAKPSEMRTAIRQFKPDVVHFICHGGFDDDGRPYLELNREQDDTDPEQYAEQLAAGLRVPDGGHPAIVVLSACHTAGSPGAERYVLAGTRENAPLATALVKGGIPIVVAMAGRITDATCRLFTRRFGEAIVTGEQLVPALAEARMATFTEAGDPDATPDWALPTMFTRPAVPPDYRPVSPPTDGDGWQQVTEFIRGSNFERGASDPVFCGRQDFFDAFRRLMAEPSPRELVLGIHVDGEGYGRGRLLEELAILAVNEGHIPILLRRPTDGQPVTLHRFGTLLSALISRSVFRTEPREALQLDALLQPPRDQDRLDPQIRSAYDLAGDVTPWTLAQAIQRDLAALLRDARADFPDVVGVHSRVVVLLDKIESYERGLLTDMFQEIDVTRGRILSPYGMGRSGEPVPVVLSFATGGDAQMLNEIALGDFTQRWMTTKLLGPLAPGEDVVAYRWVLLNPFRVPIPQSEKWEKRWAFDDSDPEGVRTLEANLHDVVQGIPLHLANGHLHLAALYASRAKVLVEADDEHLLELVRART